MLEPIEEETAMSPWPRLATAIDESASGIEVPLASRVRPMMVSGTPMRAPKSVTIQTMK